MGHSVRCVATVVGVAVLLVGGFSAPVWSQPTSPATEVPTRGPGQGQGLCERAPWIIEDVCGALQDPVGTGVSTIVGGGASAVLAAVVGFVVEGAGWLLNQLATFIDTSTRPQVTAAWFQVAYHDMTTVAVLGLLPFLLLALIQGIVRQDAGLVLRAAFVDALLWPKHDAARRVGSQANELAGASRQVALELRRLCQGDLAGMFDAPTSPGLDLTAPVVVLDLSALYGSPALGLLMLCATAWLHTALQATAAEKTIVVVDEAWAVLRQLEIARWLQASWKLSRQYGVANIAVVHRLSDLQAAGEAGSEQVTLARGLLADSETRVIYGQSPAETAAAQELLGLTDVEAELLPQLGRGLALWRVGTRSFLVNHHLGTHERALVDTDSRMT